MIMQTGDELPIGPILEGNMWDCFNEVWRLVKVRILREANEQEYREYCASINAVLNENGDFGPYYYECQVLD